MRLMTLLVVCLQPVATQIRRAALSSLAGGGGGRDYHEEPCNCVPFYQCKDTQMHVPSSEDCKTTEVCCKDKTAEDMCGWGAAAKNRNKVAESGEYPWMVAILNANANETWTHSEYVGGGAIVHPRVVLTAAHKVHGKKAEMLKCRAGEWIRTKNELNKPQERLVEKLEIHDHYERLYMANDVALLFVKEPFDVSLPMVRPVCVGKGAPPRGAECFAMGWGQLKFNSTNYDEKLKKVPAPLIPRTVCWRALQAVDAIIQKEREETREKLVKLGNARPLERHEALEKEVTETNGQERCMRQERTKLMMHSSLLCAGGEGEDTCTGDGGSPLVCQLQMNATHTRYAVYGLVAWGIGCGVPGSPGVYVDVAQFYYWINDKIPLSHRFGALLTLLLVYTQPDDSRAISAAALASLVGGVYHEAPCNCVPYYQCNYTQIQYMRSKDCKTTEVCCKNSTAEDTCGWGAAAEKHAQDAASGEFPWMVAILNANANETWTHSEYVGGGAIVHPRVVLTAAHKVHGKKAEMLKCRAGEWIRIQNEQNKPQERLIEQVEIHYHYERMYTANDVALLFLMEPFDVSLPMVRPVCVGKGAPPRGAECFAMGWGQLKFNSTNYAEKLKKIPAPLVPRTVCWRALQAVDAIIQNEREEARQKHVQPAKTKLRKDVTESNGQERCMRQERTKLMLHSSLICAGGEGEDTCTGDGGSPLVCQLQMNATHTRYAVFGLVAWGIGCGITGSPGVYVDVAQFNYWINEKLYP